VDAALEELLVEPADGTGLSHYLRDQGELWHLREYAAQRSLYHLKEADPEVWAIPRLTGRAKAALVAIEYDEYGAGRADRMHAELFAELMADLGLENRYGYYLKAATAEMLAVVNLMSLFGLHRALRGALAGHFATVEVTSSPACQRLAQAMERVRAGPAAVRFYTEHVEADAVHEQLARRELIGGLLAEEPSLEPDVVFGIDATLWVEDRFASRLLTAWQQGQSSLRVPLCGLPQGAPPVTGVAEGEELAAPAGTQRHHRPVRADDPAVRSHDLDGALDQDRTPSLVPDPARLPAQRRLSRPSTRRLRPRARHQ
jgi:hypothetical protein